VTVSINVNGATSGVSDKIGVSGTATLSSSTLDVTTQNQSPTSGNTYAFLTAVSGISGSWGSSPVNSGYSATYTFDSMSQGTLDAS
jgi:hypothetical protein